MGRQKIFKMLENLTLPELSDFKNFVIYKLDREDSNSTKLIGYLIRNKLSYGNYEISSENIFRYLYPGEKYNDKKLRDRFSALVRLLKEYLIFKEAAGSGDMNYLFLIKQFRKRNLNEEVIRLFKEGYNFFENKNVNDPVNYFNKFMFYSEYSQFFDDHFEYKHALEESLRIQNNSDNLIYFFLISMLKIYVNLFIKEKLIKFDYSFKFMDLVMNYLDNEKEAIEKIPVLKIYYEFFNILKSQTGREKYFELKLQIQRDAEKIPWEIIRELYLFLYYFANQLFNKGYSEFREEGFAIQEEMVEKGYYFESDGSIQESSFTAFIAAALRFNKLKTAEDFIVKYKDKIPPDVRQDSYYYNMAVINYMKVRLNNLNGKEKIAVLKNAGKFFAKVRQNHYQFYIRNNEFAIFLNYELSNFAYVGDLIHSYRNKLYRDEYLNPEYKSGILNFLKFTEKILSLHKNYPVNKIKQIKERIQNCGNLIYKNWLLRKLDEYIV
jgi:hypothetical protein